ncbi:hypothetical protein L3V83_14295 [Thiotrichales bacterium 19X7-9]|nr:hypothetical protein [Thiotrichales bacterium 19X7-9]
MLNNTRGLTDFILSKLKGKLPQINWQLYPNIQDLKELQLPIGNLALQQFDFTPRVTTDLKTVDCTFSIRLLFNDTSLAQLNIRDAALAVASYLHRNYLNEQIELIEVISSNQDYFTPEVNGFVAWEISFIVRFYCGDSIYQLNGISPDVELNINNHVV